LPDMKVKLAGPTFNSKITSIEAFNEYLYVATGKFIFKLHYYHIVDEYEFPENILGIMLFGQIMIVALENYSVRIMNVVTRGRVNTLH
jgi:hypothetical protein